MTPTLAQWLSNFSMPLVCWIFPSGRVVRTLQEKPSSSFSTSTALGGSNVSNVLRILSYPSSWKFKSFKEKLQLRFPFTFTLLTILSSESRYFTIRPPRRFVMIAFLIFPFANDLVDQEIHCTKLCWWEIPSTIDGWGPQKCNLHLKLLNTWVLKILEKCT